MSSEKGSANEKTASATAAATSSSSAVPVPVPPSVAAIRAGPEPSYFKNLLSAMDRNKVLEFAGYAQLATISSSTGFPSVRTVRMRAALKEYRAVMFSTDARSSKIQDLTSIAGGLANAVCELNWFFPINKEQFRLTCRVTFVDADTEKAAAAPDASADTKALAALRAAQWSGLAIPTRQLFDAAPPGTPVKSVKLGDLDRYTPQLLDPKLPAPNFVVVLLHPFRCDHLTLPPSGMVDPQKVIHHDAILKPARLQRRILHTFTTATTTASATATTAGATAAATTASAPAAAGQWEATELNP